MLKPHSARDDQASTATKLRTRFLFTKLFLYVISINPQLCETKALIELAKEELARESSREPPESTRSSEITVGLTVRGTAFPPAAGQSRRE